MTASEVKVYLQGRGRASLSDIAVHFGSSPDAVRQVLQLWRDKGRARLLTESCCNTASCNCGKKPDDVYEWVQ